MDHGGPLSNGPLSNGPLSNGPLSNLSAHHSDSGSSRSTVRKLEDWQLPTVLYFLVYHKRRFRFAKVRITDLERVLDSSDTSAVRDILARMLRVVRSGDPNVTMANAEQQLAAYFQEKRPHIAKLMAANKLNDLSFESKARLLKKVIDYLNDDVIPGWEMQDMKYEAQQSAQDDTGQVAINCGTDSRHRRHFYLDDHRLYRQRLGEDRGGSGGSGSGGSAGGVGGVAAGVNGGSAVGPPNSQQAFEMVVGPSADEWERFTASMTASKNENEHDMGMFLQSCLLELVIDEMRQGCHLLGNDELHPARLLRMERLHCRELRRARNEPVPADEEEEAGRSTPPLPQQQLPPSLTQQQQQQQQHPCTPGSMPHTPVTSMQQQGGGSGSNPGSNCSASALQQQQQQQQQMTPQSQHQQQFPTPASVGAVSNNSAVNSAGYRQASLRDPRQFPQSPYATPTADYVGPVEHKPQFQQHQQQQQQHQQQFVVNSPASVYCPPESIQLHRHYLSASPPWQQQQQQHHQMMQPQMQTAQVPNGGHGPSHCNYGQYSQPPVRIFVTQMANECTRQCTASGHCMRPDQWHQAWVDRQQAWMERAQHPLPPQQQQQQQPPAAAASAGITAEQRRKREKKIQRIIQIGQSAGLAPQQMQPPPPPPPQPPLTHPMDGGENPLAQQEWDSMVHRYSVDHQQHQPYQHPHMISAHPQHVNFQNYHPAGPPVAPTGSKRPHPSSAAAAAAAAAVAAAAGAGGGMPAGPQFPPQRPLHNYPAAAAAAGMVVMMDMNEPAHCYPVGGPPPPNAAGPAAALAPASSSATNATPTAAKSVASGASKRRKKEQQKQQQQMPVAAVAPQNIAVDVKPSILGGVDPPASSSTTSSSGRNITSASLASLDKLSKDVPVMGVPFHSIGMTHHQHHQQHSQQPPPPPPPPPQPPLQQQQQQPMVVNNTFVNAQLNVQQINYQAVNGVGAHAHMQVQQASAYPTGPMQQQPQHSQPHHQQQPQTSTGVQISAKSANTIQYKPSSQTPSQQHSQQSQQLPQQQQHQQQQQQDSASASAAAAAAAASAAAASSAKATQQQHQQVMHHQYEYTPQHQQLHQHSQYMESAGKDYYGGYQHSAYQQQQQQQHMMQHQYPLHPQQQQQMVSEAEYRQQYQRHEVYSAYASGGVGGGVGYQQYQHHQHVMHHPHPQAGPQTPHFHQAM